MAAQIESKGDIESICESDAVGPGGTARIVFRAYDDTTPPFTIKVRDPSGKIILERVIRDLPTGRPQSAPPIMFTVNTAGRYDVSVRELYGKLQGQAVLTVS